MIFRSIRRKCLDFYNNRIHLPTNTVKNKHIEVYDKRSDYKHVLVLRAYDPNLLINIIEDEYKLEDHTHNKEEQEIDSNICCLK